MLRPPLRRFAYVKIDRRTLFVPRDTNVSARQNLLLKIYKPPYEKLEKGSEEYRELAKSGRVWENYFEPWNSEKLGYAPLQRVSLAHLIFQDFSGLNMYQSALGAS